MLPGTPDADNLAADNAADGRLARGRRGRGAGAPGAAARTVGRRHPGDGRATDSQGHRRGHVAAEAKSARSARASSRPSTQRTRSDWPTGPARRRPQGARERPGTARRGAAPEQQIAARARPALRRQRLRTLAETGTGSPRIIQRGYMPTTEAGNPIQTIVLGALFGVLLGVGLALRARAGRPQAAPHRAGHGRLRRAGAHDGAAQPCAQAPQAVRGPAARRWRRRSECCR